MPSDRFDYKRIADPVHGTIGLSRLEVDVLDTAVFQRLQDVKQLGLAYLVYPGANFSRLSHCVGVSHVAGRLIDAALAREGGVDPKTFQLYRLCGLLHDLGHLPFSHATEHAVVSYYGANQRLGDGIVPGKKYSHETIGKVILESDKDLRAAIAGDVSVDDVLAVLDEESDAPYRNVISSDLDADRLDYLLRTAHFTGLPYGSIDLDYIVSRMCLDVNGNVALAQSALRAADQFLLSRYFDYRQVAFHKTTAAFEWLLEHLVRAALEVDKSLDLTPSGVAEMVRQNRWKTLTDSFMREWLSDKLGSIQTFPQGVDSLESRMSANTLRLMTRALLERKPPVLLGEIEIFERPSRREGYRNSFMSTVERLNNAKEGWSKKFDIPLDRWNVWSRDIKLTKVGSSVPWSVLVDEDGPSTKRRRKAYEQVVLLAEKHRGPSRPIMEVPQSLTSFMADYNMQIIRVYALLDANDGRRDEISRHIVETYPHEGWASTVYSGPPGTN